MKLILAISLILSAAFAHAEAMRLETDDQAFLVICPVAKVKIGNRIVIQQPLGCVNKISVNGQVMEFSAKAADVSKLLQNAIGTYQFHNLRKSRPFAVEGYKKSEMRRGVRQDVFYVEAMANLILPR